MIKPILNTPIFNINQNKQPTPTFSSRLPNDSFERIKDIPHLRCASCDEIMLTTDEFEEIKKSFMIPAKKLFECGRLDRYKEHECYEISYNLAKKHPKELFHEIVEKPEIIEELSKYSEDIRWGIGGIKFASAHTYLTAEKFIAKLSKFEDSFKDGHKELYDLMKFYSIKFPNWSFYQIFSKDKISDYHKLVAKTKEQNIALLTYKVFADIKKHSEKLNDDDKKKVEKIFADCSEDFGSHPHSAKMKKLYYIDSFTQNMDSLSDKKTAKKILKELNKLPEISSYADSVIARKPKDCDLLDEILSPLRLTFDHVLVKSKNGTDAQGNGVYLCRACNHNRGTLSYPFLFRINPDMPHFIQKQVSRISSFIKGGKLINHMSYPVEIKKTLYNETDGELLLDIENYLKFRDKLSQKDLEEAKELLNANTEILEEATEKYNEILANYLKFKHMLKRAGNKLKVAEKDQKESEEIFDKKTKERQKVDKIIADDKSPKKKK